MPTALATTYTTRADAESILSVEGVALRLDDDASGTESGTETAYLTSQGINWASAEINLYLLGRYAASELATSWKVHQIASDFLARWLCLRRGNPVPKSLNDRCGEPDAESGHYYVLSALMRNEMQLADINSRVLDGPGVSNVRVDPRYGVKQIRVERPLSDKTPRDGNPPAWDYQSEYAPEW